jgi:hypothetical protein
MERFGRNRVLSAPGPDQLTLTEIMYNPPPVGLTNGDEFEFVEVKNAGTNTLNLSGLRFTDAIDFVFTNGTLLAPGEFFVLARNAAAFSDKYPGIAVNGIMPADSTMEASRSRFRIRWVRRSSRSATTTGALARGTGRLRVLACR